MIYVGGNKKVVAIEKPLSAFMKRVFLEIRKGVRIIWTAIKSCYGGGVWDEGKPWIDNDTWKNDR